jgi:hypothetical protein
LEEQVVKMSENPPPYSIVVDSPPDYYVLFNLRRPSRASQLNRPGCAARAVPSEGGEEEEEGNVVILEGTQALVQQTQQTSGRVPTTQYRDLPNIGMYRESVIQRPNRRQQNSSDFPVCMLSLLTFLVFICFLLYLGLKEDECSDAYFSKFKCNATIVSKDNRTYPYALQ